MRVLMLGWEFPPFFAGGAGMVCKELSEGLVANDVEVTFVMPHGPKKVYDKLNVNTPDSFNIRIADNFSGMRLITVPSLLSAYQTKDEYLAEYFDLESEEQKALYGSNLRSEIYRFAELVEAIFENEEFDVIHAHDWVTFPAAVKLKEKTGKPLVTHIHITEFDKSGGEHADPFIYSVEKLGMHHSDKIICVSDRVRQRVVSNYYIPEQNTQVVHNAAIPMGNVEAVKSIFSQIEQQIVLFAGRVTLQKGPEYFVEAAKHVLEHAPDTLFVVAGSGDMLPRIMEQTAHLGIASSFLFTGFYTREQAEELFGLADVFVMPSVSEPFGIVPYEAQSKKTPTIISKQSGISEVLEHCLQVDFWDTHKMAEYILSLLHYEHLNQEMRLNGYMEAKNATWHKPAQECKQIYEDVTEW